MIFCVHKQITNDLFGFLSIHSTCLELHSMLNLYCIKVKLLKIRKLQVHVVNFFIGNLDFEFHIGMKYNSVALRFNSMF